VTLAVIGGTGFGAFAGLTETKDHVIETDFGPAEIQSGRLQGQALLFLPRHGMPARFLPHKINYRANIKALQMLGASRVLAVTAVGTVSEDLRVPCLVVPDQIIDYTDGRALTFFEDQIHHIDFTQPYDAAFRSQLLAAVTQVAAHHSEMQAVLAGVYGCTQGPRLETAAEVRRLRNDGCSIVGMTAMPEAVLARELALPYAGISVTVNPGAGMADRDISLAEINQAMNQGLAWVKLVLAELLSIQAV
tara:strand:+ start:4545 stop:5288 length:744 start_codon:yes stop_codon:yes gene_type:complete